MPLQATSGAASQDAFGGNGVAVVPAYIEEVFSCFVYTGTGATQSITNNIDVTGKGALVWLKRRNSTNDHFLFDTARGVNTGSQALSSNTTAAGGAGADIAFSSTGFDLTQTGSNTNGSGATYASWTVRKQPKFFDIQTWTGSGANRTIAHNLGSVPGCIIVKATSRTSGWETYHRSTGAANVLFLNTTAASVADGGIYWNGTAPTSSVFSLGTSAGVNGSGETYVAYLFAHDAGGFGLTGTDNVISCGTFTETGTTYPTATVSLGWEPQFILAKPTNTAGDWFVVDTMRKLPAPTGTCTYLLPNSSAAEATAVFFNVNATGFTVHPVFGNGTTYIYIAIRRGPMKVPTTGTSVFSPIFSTTVNAILTTGFPVDMQFEGHPPSDALNMSINDRLRGVSTTTTQSALILTTSSTAAEASPTPTMTRTWSNTGFTMPGYYGGVDYISWNFRRAPSFMDTVCFTGTGSATTFSHNLQAVPELMIVKRRDASAAWDSYCSALANTEYIVLNTTAAKASGATRWNSTTPTSSVFSVGTSTTTNASAGTYIAWLFATCAGVSKIFSYTGNGSSQTINCGFTAGARFVLIKRTDSTGDWYVWDTARGIVAGNDPHLSLNTIVAEVTTDDTIDTDNTGFVVNQVAATNVNVSSATYIGLAVA